jgi:branched-chain amino acid transport system substrate-binding protein
MGRKFALPIVMVALLLAIGLIFAPFSFAGNVSGKSIKLGGIYSIAGVCAEWGNAAKIASEIAIEEINAAGGIGGVPIEQVWYDVGCKAPPAIPVVEKLAKQDKVLAVNGP